MAGGPNGWESLIERMTSGLKRPFVQDRAQAETAQLLLETTRTPLKTYLTTGILVPNKSLHDQIVARIGAVSGHPNILDSPSETFDFFFILDPKKINRRSLTRIIQLGYTDHLPTFHEGTLSERFRTLLLDTLHAGARLETCSHLNERKFGHLLHMHKQKRPDESKRQLMDSFADRWNHVVSHSDVQLLSDEECDFLKDLFDRVDVIGRGRISEIAKRDAIDAHRDVRHEVDDAFAEAGISSPSSRSAVHPVQALPRRGLRIY